MEINEFLFWLKGAFEMNPEIPEKGMSPQQVRTIQDHLNLVFNKITPDRFEDINIQDSNSISKPQLLTGKRHDGLVC